MGSSPTKGVGLRAQKYVQSDNSDCIDHSSLATPTPVTSFNGRIPSYKEGLRPNSAPNVPKKDEVIDSGVSSGRHSITSFYNETDNELYRKFFRGRNCTEDDNTDDTGWDPTFEDLSISDKSDKCKSPKVLRKFNRDSLKNTQ